MTEDYKDIVDVLERVTPGGPDPKGWAGQVRRRHRRRSGLLAGAVGAVAVALAVPVGIGLTQPRIVATPADHGPGGLAVLPDPAPGGLPGAAACYDADGQPVQVREGEGIVPGAVKAWLCGDGNVAGPLEPLVTDVNRIVDFVAGQEVADVAAMTCTMEYRLAYTVVLEYADGTRRPVLGELHGCRLVHDGATWHFGGEEFYSFVRGLWSEQRAEVAAPAEPPLGEACPVPAAMLPPSLDEVTGARICPDTRTDRTPVPAELAARIASDVRAHSVKGEPGVEMEPAYSVSLSGPWGDTVTFHRLADEFAFWYSDADDVTWIWTPSDELVLELVNPLGNGHPAPQPSGTEG